MKGAVGRYGSSGDNAALRVKEIADATASQVLDACRVRLEEIEEPSVGGTLQTGCANGVHNGAARLELHSDKPPAARTRVGLQDDHVVLGAGSVAAQACVGADRARVE